VIWDRCQQDEAVLVRSLRYSPEGGRRVVPTPVVASRCRGPLSRITFVPHSCDGRLILPTTSDLRNDGANCGRNTADIRRKGRPDRRRAVEPFANRERSIAVHCLPGLKSTLQGAFEQAIALRCCGGSVRRAAKSIAAISSSAASIGNWRWMCPHPRHRTRRHRIPRHSIALSPDQMTSTAGEAETNFPAAAGR